MKLCLLVFLRAALAFSAPADVEIFSAQDLQKMAESMEVKGSSYADRNLARYKDHYLLLVKREESGSSEVHEHEADIFVVENGQGTLLSGGTLVKPHTIKTGEIRGAGIAGGVQRSVSAGDIIHIPAGTPHQLLLEKGKPFTYFVVKVAGQ